MTTEYKDVTTKATLLTDNTWFKPVSGDYAYRYGYSGSSTGAVITNKSGADEWDNYQATGYIEGITDAAENKFGFIMRYQDTDNYYFVGLGIADNGNSRSTYEVWEKSGGSYSRITNNYDTGDNSNYGLPTTIGTSGLLSTGTEYHVRVNIRGNSCRMYIQNEKVFENLVDFNTYDEGQFGLEAQTSSSKTITCYFDDIKVVA